ncbi:TPR-like protein [Sistotremastrum suecicum HHB10207 ss-3]|uniref:TPR-like protein n=1 Tax=Sistotremastrum suecicum HHB10207 ss-3 TaxID=1314776 RepID=A0A165YZ95_9AGAM|nr:TPR-like protein [Sistotremastrum suecicum HHB10207 ss-3]
MAPNRRNSTVLLQGLVNIAAVSSPLEIKSLAAVSYSILSTAQTARTAREEAIRVGERAAELAMAISSSIPAQPSLSHEMIHIIENVTNSLREIQDELSGVPKEDGLKGTLQTSKIQSTSKKCEDILDGAISRFLRLSDEIQSRVSVTEGALQSSMEKIRRKELDLIAQRLDGVVMHGTRRSPVLLPMPPEIFHGREKEVDAIVDLLGTEGAHCAILGTGGMGKTSLTLKVLHDSKVIETFATRRHFIPCESATDADSLLVLLSSHFDMTPRGFLPTLSRILRTTRRRVLLVLDNLETCWEPSSGREKVEALLSKLTECVGLNLLVTMRGAERPSNVRWHRPFLPVLSTLTPSAATQTFLEISDAPQDDPIIPQLIKRLEYIPLAIVLLANLAQSTTCQELLRRWEETHTEMLTRGHDTRLSSLDVSIRLTLDSERLVAVPEATIVLKALSLLPDGLAQADLLQSVSLKPAECSAAVAALKRVAVLSQSSPDGRLRLLSPIADFVRATRPMDAAEFVPILNHFLALQRSVEWGKRDLGNPNRLAQFASHSANLHQVLRFAILHRIKTADVIRAITKTTILDSVHGADSTTPFLIHEARKASQELGDRELEAACVVEVYKTKRIFASQPTTPKQDVAHYEEALEICRQLGDKKSEVSLMMILAATRLRTASSLDKVASTFQEALTLSRQISYPRGIAHCLRGLAEVAVASGNLKDAVQFATDSMKVSEQHSLFQVTAHCLEVLAKVYDVRGAFPLALRYFQRALQTLEVYFPGHSGRGHILHALGDLYFKMSMLPQAREAYLGAYNVFAQMSQQDWMHAIRFYLAKIVLMQGQIDDAVPQIHVTLRFFAERQFTDTAYCLTTLGRVEMLRGNNSLAYSYLHESLAYYRKLHTQGTYLWGESSMLMGDLLLKEQRPISALVSYTRAVVIERQRSDIVGLAEAIRRLGDAFRQLSDIDTAKACYDVTLSMIGFLGVRGPIADCLVSMGKVSLLEGDIHGAREHFLKADKLYHLGDLSVGKTETAHLLSQTA